MNKAEQRLRLDCPNEAIVRDLSWRANEAQHILFGLKNLGNVIDPNGECAVRTQQLLDQANSDITRLTPELGKQRREHVQTERKKDEWASPSCIDGWMCPDSLSGACEYENGDPDNCDYCGFPEERK